MSKPKVSDINEMWIAPPIVIEPKYPKFDPYRSNLADLIRGCGFWKGALVRF